ncbi:MAG: small ribosomal subunit Rsm22 family protein [Spirochaetales bacterium]
MHIKEQAYIPILIDAYRSFGNSNHPAPLQGLNNGEIGALAKQVRAISLGLTRERKLAGVSYLDHSELLGAYLFYYWPISYRIATTLLASLLPDFMLHFQKTEFSQVSRSRSTGFTSFRNPQLRGLDLGAGAGPFSFALLDAGVQDITAWERSTKALKALEYLARKRGVHVKTQKVDLEKSFTLPEQTFHFITLGYVLNELWKQDPDRVQKRFQLIKSLLNLLEKEGKMILVEPALPALSQELLYLRDLLTKEDLVWIQSPCFRQGNCPALPEGTCHTSIPWHPPSLVREIGRRARIMDRTEVKFSYLVLCPQGSSSHPPFPSAVGENNPSVEGFPHRVVSDPLISKSGRTRYLLCGPLGRFSLSASGSSSSALGSSRMGKEIKTKGEGKKESALEVFFSLRRGDVVTFFNLETRSNGYGVTDQTILKILQRQ